MNASKKTGGPVPKSSSNLMRTNVRYWPLADIPITRVYVRTLPVHGEMSAFDTQSGQTIVLHFRNGCPTGRTC